MKLIQKAAQKMDLSMQDKNNGCSRCRLVPLVNPAKLEVNVWLD